MAVTAGALSLVQAGQTSNKLVSAAATAGTAPYTYQWYRSTTSGFSPGGGNIIAGATSLSLTDSGLVPNTTYYYKVVATDAVPASNTSAQLAVTTLQGVPSINAFAQAPVLGMLDLRFNPTSVGVQIDASQVGALYAGSPVKIVNSAHGVPKVVACSADSDSVLGFINYNIKDQALLANMPCEISMSGNVIYLYATAGIARGAQVCIDLAGNGIKAVSGAGGENIVGWAYDQASAGGQLIRVMLVTPSFKFDA